jgi:hypothetical protein
MLGCQHYDPKPWGVHPLRCRRDLTLRRVRATTWSVTNRLETKFLCVAASVAIGSHLDGWQVVWCQRDRSGVLWHIMLVRPRIEFRGCCG